jgi:hypothetical protein
MGVIQSSCSTALDRKRGVPEVAVPAPQGVAERSSVASYFVANSVEERVYGWDAIVVGTESTNTEIVTRTLNTYEADPTDVAGHPELPSNEVVESEVDVTADAIVVTTAT